MGKGTWQRRDRSLHAGSTCAVISCCLLFLSCGGLSPASGIARPLADRALYTIPPETGTVTEHSDKSVPLDDNFPGLDAVFARATSDFKEARRDDQFNPARFTVSVLSKPALTITDLIHKVIHVRTVVPSWPALRIGSREESIAMLMAICRSEQDLWVRQGAIAALADLHLLIKHPADGSWEAPSFQVRFTLKHSSPCICPKPPIEASEAATSDLLEFLLDPKAPTEFNFIAYQVLSRISDEGIGRTTVFQIQSKALEAFLIRRENTSVQFVTEMLLNDKTGTGEVIVTRAMSRLDADNRFAAVSMLRAIDRSLATSLQLLEAIELYLGKLGTKSEHNQRVVELAEYVLRRKKQRTR